MNKDITFGAEAHKRIQAGVDKLAEVVKTTLGPGGTNVILERGATQVITKDGVSVAREIFFEDPLENIGAQIVKAVAQKTVEEAGDGTTSSVVLAQAVFREGLKNVAAGAKQIEIKRGIDKAVAEVVKEIKKRSTEIKKGDVQKIAVISANGDEVIGKLVGDAMEAVGLEGLVTVEESKSLDTYVKRVEGMRWDRGFMSLHFATNPAKAESLLIDPVILIYDGNINSLREMMGKGKYNIIDRYRSDPEMGGKPLVIIAHDFGAEIVATLAVNHQNKAIQCVLVQAPEFGELRKAVMEDIAALTGATVISKESGLRWEDVKLEHLGHAERVRTTQWTTTVVNSEGSLRAQHRANQIREQLQDTNEHAAHVLKIRLARLVNGLMVIYVGGASELEVKEKMDRIDDSLNATRAAIEEGILPGAGLAYARIAQDIAWNGIPHENKDQMTGINIIQEIMKIPFMTIVDNAGGKPEVVLAEVFKKDDFAWGYNSATHSYENLLETGVIDPAKVVRLALENAASVAGMLLTTKAVVSVKPVRP